LKLKPCRINLVIRLCGSLGCQPLTSLPTQVKLEPLVTGLQKFSQGGQLTSLLCVAFNKFGLATEIAIGLVIVPLASKGRRYGYGICAKKCHQQGGQQEFDHNDAMPTTGPSHRSPAMLGPSYGCLILITPPLSNSLLARSILSWYRHSLVTTLTVQCCCTFELVLLACISRV
jgi:hypothetical protein